MAGLICISWEKESAHLDSSWQGSTLVLVSSQLIVQSGHMCVVVALGSGCLIVDTVSIVVVACRCFFAFCILPFVSDRPRTPCRCQDRRRHLLTCLRRPCSLCAGCACPAFALDIDGMSLELAVQGVPAREVAVTVLQVVAQPVDPAI